MRIFEPAGFLTVFVAASLVAQVSSASAAPSDGTKIVTSGQHQVQLDIIVQPLALGATACGAAGSNLKLSPDHLPQEQAQNLSKRGLTDLGDELGVIFQGSTSRPARVVDYEPSNPDAGVATLALPHLEPGSGLKRKAMETPTATSSPPHGSSDTPMTSSDSPVPRIAEDTAPTLPQRTKRAKVAPVWHDSMEAEWGRFLKSGDRAKLESDNVVLRRKIWPRLRSRKSRFTVQEAKKVQNSRPNGQVGLIETDEEELGSTSLKRPKRRETAPMWDDSMDAEWSRFIVPGSRDRTDLASEKYQDRRKAWGRLRSRRSIFAKQDVPRMKKVQKRRPRGVVGLIQSDVQELESGDLGRAEAVLKRINQRIWRANKVRPSEDSSEWATWKRKQDADEADRAQVANKVAELQAAQPVPQAGWMDKSRRPKKLVGRTQEELDFCRSGDTHKLNLLRLRLTQLIATAQRGETGRKRTELWQAQLRDNVAWRHGINLLANDLPEDIEKQIPNVLAATESMPINIAVERIPKLLSQLVEQARSKMPGTPSSLEQPGDPHGVHRASTGALSAAHYQVPETAASHPVSVLVTPQKSSSTSFSISDSFLRQLEGDLEDASEASSHSSDPRTHT